MAGIQAIIFRKHPRFPGDPAWSLQDAQEYLRAHELNPLKFHETTNFYRFRLSPPKLYKNLFTSDRRDGIMMIVGELAHSRR